MNMTAELRATSNMRRLRKGDRFMENDELWEVTGAVEIISATRVLVPMKRVEGVRARRYTYNGDDRVKLVD